MTQATNGALALPLLSNQLADAVERIGPAVVQVNGRPRRPSSGVVFAPDLVIAAAHAIERDDHLSVETTERPALAGELLGRDPASDLAVLRVPGLTTDPAPRAAAAARVGQLILAVGRPAGRELMASIGVVSAVGGPLRTHGGLLEQYLRTDATPYPGFSGGALIDAQGAVLGILTTGLAGGVALAVPVAVAWRLGDLLARQGYVARGWLGVGSQPIRIPPAQRAGRDREGGLLVVEVAPGSPAERGGLLLGDILLALDGHAVVDVDDLHAVLGGDRVGRTVPIEALRGGAVIRLEVTVGQRPGGAR